MGRPAQFDVETKMRVVLSVLGGECSAAEAARRCGSSETSVAKWRDQFVQAGRAGLAGTVATAVGGRGTARERVLVAEAEQLKLAVAEAHVQLRVWQKGAEHASRVPSQTSR